LDRASVRAHVLLCMLAYYLQCTCFKPRPDLFDIRSGRPRAQRNLNRWQCEPSTGAHAGRRANAPTQYIANHSLARIPHPGSRSRTLTRIYSRPLARSRHRQRLATPERPTQPPRPRSARRHAHRVETRHHRPNYISFALKSTASRAKESGYKPLHESRGNNGRPSLARKLGRRTSVRLYRCAPCFRSLADRFDPPYATCRGQRLRLIPDRDSCAPRLRANPHRKVVELLLWFTASRSLAALSNVMC